MSETKEAVVLWEDRGPVALVTINRPAALNALNGQVLSELAAAFDAHGHRENLRAVVLTGAGKAFVAGADITEMMDMSPAQAEAFARRGASVADAIERLPVPVIAAVNGFALGGGCELAMACDFAIASSRAKFGQPEVKLGVIPGFGGTQRLTRRVGMTLAMDLCLTGRMIGADEALRAGLVSQVIDDDVVDAALKLAGLIAGNGPVAVRYARQAIAENADSALAPALAAERQLFALCFATSDQKEGMSAFAEKRKAEFTGR